MTHKRKFPEEGAPNPTTRPALAVVVGGMARFRIFAAAARDGDARYSGNEPILSLNDLRTSLDALGLAFDANLPIAIEIERLIAACRGPDLPSSAPVDGTKAILRRLWVLASSAQGIGCRWLIARPVVTPASRG
jgi:hypothetical protein